MQVYDKLETECYNEYLVKLWKVLCYKFDLQYIYKLKKQLHTTNRKL